MACSTGAYQHGWVPIDGHVSTAVCSSHVLAHGSKWRGTDAGANQNEVVKLLEVFRRSPERSPNLDLKALWHTIPVSPRPEAPPSKYARANTHLQATHGSDVLELHARSSCRPFTLGIRRNSRLLRLGKVAQFVGPVAQPLDVELHEGVRRAGCDGERVELAGRHRGNADLTVLASLVPGNPPSR